MCRIHAGNFGKCARNYKCHWVYVYMLEVPYCAGNVSETLNLLSTGNVHETSLIQCSLCIQ